MTVLFDDYGYVDADLVCAGLPHRENNNECVAGWIGRSMKLLRGKGYEFEDFYCYSKARGGESLQSVIEKRRYQLIGYYDVEKDRKAYVVTKDGLVLLARAAKMIGHKIAEADSLLAELGIEDNEPIIVVEKKKRGKAKPKAEPKAEVILNIEVEPVVPAPEPDDDSEDGVDLQTSDRELMTVESFPEALSPDICQSYIWKQGGKPIAVILSSQYASICKMRTYHLNQKIRDIAEKGNLVDGVDFIVLSDKSEISAFSVINDLDISSQEFRKNLYLLTTIGVAHLAMHLRNAQAKAQQDYAASSAVVVHNLEKKILEAQDAKIAELVTSNTKLMTFYTDIVTWKNDLVIWQEELANWQADLMKSQRETGTKLDTFLANMMEHRNVQGEPVMNALTGLTTEVQAISTGLKAVDSRVDTRVDTLLSEKKIYREGQIPAHLICYDEIRRRFIPSVSSTRFSKYFKYINHPGEDWKKLLSDGVTMQPIHLLLRDGIDRASALFFSKLVYVQATPKVLHFRGEGIGSSLLYISTAKKRQRDETWRFLQELIRHNPKYSNYEVNPKTLEFKPKKVEEGAWGQPYS